MKVLQRHGNLNEVHILFPANRSTHFVARAKEVHTQISHKGISRQHAMLLDLPSEDIVVVDLDSTNHTSVNGTNVAPFGEIVVKPGSIINFASIPYIYQIMAKEQIPDPDARDKTECLPASQL